MKIIIPLVIKLEIEYGPGIYGGEHFYTARCPEFIPPETMTGYSSENLPHVITNMATVLSKQLTPERLVYEITKKMPGLERR
jgi:hypothetical protein